jgi:hypothetical protein
MPTTRVVRDGECIASIAWEHGIRPQDVWNDPANQALRTLRANGYVLQPGDELTIPDRRPRVEAAVTGQRHVFRRLDVPEKLNVILLDTAGAPREGVGWTVEIDGYAAQTGTTAADGRIAAWIPPAATGGRLLLDKSAPVALGLGRLRPIDTDEGVRARLANLGYLRDTAQDAEADLLAAVIRFQIASKLAPTGTIDAAFRNALLAEHGS